MERPTRLEILEARKKLLAESYHRVSEEIAKEKAKQK